MSFGTGGMRGIVGAGTGRINRYTFRRVTSALCLYLKKAFPGESSLKVAMTLILVKHQKNFLRLFLKF